MDTAPFEIPMGVCRNCGRRFAKRGMGRHLSACERAGAAAGRPAGSAGLLLRVEGAHAPDYWMFLALRPNATWDDLDASLRHLWVECCGHLSDFELGGRDWLNLPDEGGEDPVAARVGHGDGFRYHYDFGSTTELKLQVVCSLPSAREEAVTLLARNEPPHRPCDGCGAEATLVTYGGRWYCAACAAARKVEEGTLPVVNSPRVGVCGYTGRD